MNQKKLLRQWLLGRLSEDIKDLEVVNKCANDIISFTKEIDLLK